MDKQKQIEEMAAIIVGLAGFSAYEKSEFLVTAGYRKIPENAVVLTREEYDELQKGVQTRNYTAMFRAQDAYSWERGYLLARKETAEKFAKRLKEKLNEWLEDNEDDDGKIDFGIAEIEMIGVKSLDGEVIAESLIDEIAKEITEGKYYG